MNTKDSTLTIIQQTKSIDTNTQEYILVSAIVVITILLIYCIYRKFVSSDTQKTKSKILNEGNIDFSNVIDSSFKAKALYDKLKKVCHPDKFAKDEALTIKSTEIFSLIVKNKHNYNELLRLKERAKKELNIHIKED